MRSTATESSFPRAAQKAFERMFARDWGGGISMEELLARVNRVASKLGPLVRTPDSRVRMTLKERSFRHYQTLGCIDPGERDGRRVVYGLKHFVQALLVRRLLLEKVSAERIVEIVKNRSTQELREGLFSGISAFAPQIALSSDLSECGQVQTWRRCRMAPGIEVSLCEDLVKSDADSLDQLLDQIRNFVNGLREA